MEAQYVLVRGDSLKYVCAEALERWRTASEDGPYKRRKNPREGGLKPPLQRKAKRERPRCKGFKYIEGDRITV